MSAFHRVKSTVQWVIGFFTQLLKPIQYDARFVVLTPPLLSQQFILDRRNRKFIRVWIRDIVDSYVMRQVFVGNDYGIEKLPRFKNLQTYYDKMVAQGHSPLIIDCGANSGMSVRYFSETYPQAQIVAIEPNQENMNLAKLNNSGLNVAYHLAGVGSSDTRADLQDPGQGNWAYRMEAKADGEVEIVSLNTILESQPKEIAPFIVKVDIEGFESDLFKQNVEWVDQFPLLIIELHDWMLPGQANSRNFLTQISQRDRDFICHSENVFSVSNTLL